MYIYRERERYYIYMSLCSGGGGGASLPPSAARKDWTNDNNNNNNVALHGMAGAANHEQGPSCSTHFARISP